MILPHKSLQTLILIVLFSAPSLFADSLPVGSPEKLGVSADRLERVSSMARRYVAEAKVPGMLTMVARRGELLHFEVTGRKGLDDPRPLAKDDLFRIYSMTKPITAIAAMQLYEQGEFQLSDPISKWVPELAELSVMTSDGSLEPAQSAITMHQLLTHTAGFSYGFVPDDPVDKLYRESEILRSKDLKAFVAKLAKLPLKFQPGTAWNYSVAVDVTGLVIERISGQRFDHYLQEHVFSPLGMNDTFFAVPDKKLGRFLPNHIFDADSRSVQPLGSESVTRYQNATLFSGGGGLVSTAADYMRFAEMLRNDGKFNGVRIIGPKTLSYMTQSHLSDDVRNVGAGDRLDALSRFFPGQTFGLGFGIVNDPAANGVLGSAGEFYWGGAAGTVFWVDPVEDIVAIGMIQLMPSPWSFRQDFRVAVYQALETLQ
ncbi:MAG: serine hydrolase domain-containing protein [Pseudomonadales bacterium]